MERNRLIIGITLVVLAAGGAVLWATGHVDSLPGNYFLYELGGEYDCGYPTLSPDGTKIAYVATIYPDRHSSDLWIVDTRTWHTQRLTSFGNVSFRPYWNPSGDTIAFFADQGIWTVERNGSNLTRLTADRSLELCRGWSPDGKRIAYLFNDSFWVMNADGGNTRQIIDGTSTTFDKIFSAWSPDGTRIAVSCPEGLLIVEVDGGMDTLMEVGDCSLPAWSPDGSRIAYVSTDGIQTVRPDGSGNRKIVDDHVFPSESPTWLASGDKIAYLTWDKEIKVVNADGTGERVVTSIKDGISFSVSGDGKRVAYSTLGTVRLSRMDGIDWCKPVAAVLDMVRLKNLQKRSAIFTGPPQITFVEPAERVVNDTVGENRTFTVGSNEPVTMTFYLDSDERVYLRDEGVRQASYVFENVSPGTHTVAVSVVNESWTRMGTTWHSWTWHVLPDQPIEPGDGSADEASYRG
ncbi:hypothetical protein [Methanoculleus bourgensis]|uniref:hypothetical protein n=1 Tax=Methanoculleus bourgensis TaxID=83986 RepID=UPI0022EE718C|nr:hypothetical protein [Methanoculleus bourgensis]GLI47762.1 hypothetical protein MBOURGENBZM_25540 [Methanoculleus bourgensis]